MPTDQTIAIVQQSGMVGLLTLACIWLSKQTATLAEKERAAVTSMLELLKTELKTMRELAESRERAIQQLREDNATLRSQLNVSRNPNHD